MGFERLGLLFNPFPLGPAEKHVYGFLEAVVGSYEHSLARSLALKALSGFVGVAFVGPWGCGKTHRLLYLRRVLMQIYGSTNVVFYYAKPSTPEDLSSLAKSLASSPRNSIVYVAVDRFENVVRFVRGSRYRERRLCSRVRELIGSRENRYVFAVASQESEWEFATRICKELGSFEVVKLKPLSPSDAKAVFAAYLRRAWAKDFGDSLHPFTEKAFEELYRLSCGVPRLLLDYAHEIVEKMAYVSSDGTIKDFDVAIYTPTRRSYILRVVTEDLLPFNPSTTHTVLSDVLEYITAYHPDLHIVLLGSTKRGELVAMAGRETVLVKCSTEDSIAEAVEEAAEALKKGVVLDDREMLINRAVIAVFTNSKQLKMPMQRIQNILAEAGNRLDIVPIETGESGWGEIAAYYLHTKRGLVGYINSYLGEKKAARKILEKLKLI